VRIDRQSIKLGFLGNVSTGSTFRTPLGGRGKIERRIVVAPKPKNCPGYPGQLVRECHHCRIAINALFELRQPSAQAWMLLTVNVNLPLIQLTTGIHPPIARPNQKLAD
jgi:hypothetical protein